MDEFKRRAIEALQDIPDDASQPDGLDIGDILDGSTPLDLSHAGGEFNQILEDGLRSERRCVSFVLCLPYSFLANCNRRRVDPRTRRDRIEQRTQGFNVQMPAIIEAYMLWSEAVGENGLDAECEKPAEELVDGKYPIHVLDVFCGLSFLSILIR